MDTAHTTKTSPRDFFLHLAVFAALYVSAVSILRLWFEVIDTLIPDPLAHARYYSGFTAPSLRAAVASLVVVFPLYLVFSRLSGNEDRRDSSRRKVWIRTWLTYITLFAAGVTLVIDGIILINTFLGGELSARFALKVVAVFTVAGVVFGYYLADARRHEALPKKRGALLLWGVSVLVLLSIIGSFFIIGSPTTTRLRRLDEQRVSHLQAIQWQVLEYWQQKSALPETLSLLENPLTGFSLPADPQNAAAYEYRLVSALSFELCATFSLSDKTLSDSRARGGFTKPVSVPYPHLGEAWTHEAGRSCFERTIDPDLYPARKPQRMPIRDLD